MAEQEFRLDLGFYESNSLPLAAQECVNMFPQNPQTIGALSTGALFHTPGIGSFTTTAGGPNRGAYGAPINGVPYVVSGQRLYSVNSNWTNTELGTVAGTSRVSMASNGTVVAIIVPGSAGYFHNIESGTTTEITDSIFLEFMAQDGGVTSVAYKSGFFVYTTNIEFFSGSANTADENFGQNFNALDFDIAKISPDKNVRAVTINDELYICGTKTLQLFQQFSTPDFVFQSIDGASISKGLAARFGIIEFDGSALFIGGSPKDGIGIFRVGAGTAVKKSTSTIDGILDTYTQDEIETCFAFAWGEDGNLFAGFTLPRHTFIFNGTASAIQGRPVWTTCETDDSRWRVQDVFRAYNKNFVTDSVDGRVGVLSINTSSEYGVGSAWSVAGAFASNLGRTLTYSSVELVIEAGVGLEGGEPSGTDPQIRLEISNDGGRTFDDFGGRSMGKQNEFKKRLIWNRVGDSDFSSILRFSGDDPVKTRLLKLIVDVEGGN